MSGHGVDESTETVFSDGAGGEGHFFDGIGAVVQSHGVGHERMPVVQVTELDVDAIGELELLIAQ